MSCRARVPGLMSTSSWDSSACLIRACSCTCPAVYLLLPNGQWCGSIAPEPNVPFLARHEPILPPRLSPDGQRFAFNTPIAGDTNVWVSDILRGSVTRLANEGPSEAPLWAPDGQRIAFTSVQGDRTDIVLKAVDGGSVERLTTRASPVFVLSWTPDGS